LFDKKANKSLLAYVCLKKLVKKAEYFTKTLDRGLFLWYNQRDIYNFKGIDK
jgi:hypothetical protein